jgi:hypothetical protein
LGQAIDSSSAPSRRGFLYGLTSLPLLGGALEVLGHPVAAATPVTPALMRRYRDFLSRELLTAHAEIDQMLAPWRHFGPQRMERWDLADPATFVDRIGPVTFVCAEGPATQAVALRPPSTRAALVLSAAGVPLPE